MTKFEKTFRFASDMMMEIVIILERYNKIDLGDAELNAKKHKITQRIKDKGIETIAINLESLRTEADEHFFETIE